MLLRRMKCKVTVHGFRSSFRDWATEVDKTEHATAERCLAHVFGNDPSLSYDRSDRLELRRPVMEAGPTYDRAKPALTWCRSRQRPASDDQIDPHHRRSDRRQPGARRPALLLDLVPGLPRLPGLARVPLDRVRSRRDDDRPGQRRQPLVIVSLARHHRHHHLAAWALTWWRDARWTSLRA